MASGLPQAKADFAGLDTVLSPWFLQAGTLRFSAAMELKTYLPFPKERLDMMNALLQHLSFQAALEQSDGDFLTTFALSCDGESLFSLKEQETDGAFALETSLLPHRVLTSASLSPIAMLSGQRTPLEPEPSFDALSAISEAQSSYQDLINACAPYAQSKKANYRIKDIGTAKWSQIARLSTEESDAMLPLLRTVLGSGMDEAHRAELDQVRFGPNFIVALYKLGEKDKDIAVYMKGDLLYPDKSTRKLAYQWAFVDKGTERKDSYQYEFSKSGKLALSRVASSFLTQKRLSDQLSLKGSWDLTLKGAGITTVESTRVDLSGNAKGSSRTLKGALSQQRKETQGEKTAATLTTYTPDLTLTVSGPDGLLSGSIQTESKKDKAVTTAMTFSLASEVPSDFLSATEEAGLYAVREEPTPAPSAALPASSIVQNEESDPVPQASFAWQEASPPQDAAFLVGQAPIGMQSYAAPQEKASLVLDALSATAYSDLLEELSQNLAAKLLLALTKLPSEDLALLKDGMTDSDYDRFLSFLGSL